MKVSNFVFSAIISSVLFVSSAFAADGSGNGSGSKAAETSVRTQIAGLLSDLSKSGEVMVYFKATSDKGFELLKVEGKDANLVNDVKNRLATEKIETPEGLVGQFVVKVRFSENDSFVETKSTADILRNAVVKAVNNVSATETSSVTVVFSVTGNKLKVIKVMGTNKDLTSKVEASLDNTEVKSSENLAGNYQINVSF